MTKGRVQLHSQSLKPWVAYMERLEQEPTTKTRLGLVAILDAAYAESQINVHVETGALRTSGFTQDEARVTPRTSRWKGLISYGLGLSYSGYETKRDGVRANWAAHPSHDMYDGLEKYYEAVDLVLEELGEL